MGGSLISELQQTILHNWLDTVIAQYPQGTPIYAKIFSNNISHGANAHPSYSAQVDMGNELAQFIRSNLGWGQAVRDTIVPTGGNMVENDVEVALNVSVNSGDSASLTSVCNGSMHIYPDFHAKYGSHVVLKSKICP